MVEQASVEQVLQTGGQVIWNRTVPYYNQGLIYNNNFSTIIFKLENIIECFDLINCGTNYTKIDPNLIDESVSYIERVGNYYTFQNLTGTL